MWPGGPIVLFWAVGFEFLLVVLSQMLNKQMDTQTYSSTERSELENTVSVGSIYNQLAE